ncbi:MAG: hypothetical protein ACFFF4_17385 [Candidatus Thorarchaeota archaeon]
MLEFVKGKSLVGPGIILIGGIYSIVMGLIGVILKLTIYKGSELSILPAYLLILFGIMVLLLGFIAVIGGMFSNYITLILGVVLIYAWLFVLPPITVQDLTFTYYLVGVAPILFTVGGLLGVVLKE